jgi:hypothetical protein
MTINITKTITKTVPLHTQKAEVVFASIEELFDEMCEKNDKEYLKLLRRLKPYVDDCHSGWGLDEKS